jgi:hypothetical protein
MIIERIYWRDGKEIQERGDEGMGVRNEKTKETTFLGRSFI